MFLRTELKTYINNLAKTSTLKEFCFSTSVYEQRMVVKTWSAQYFQLEHKNRTNILQKSSWQVYQIRRYCHSKDGLGLRTFLCGRVLSYHLQRPAFDATSIKHKCYLCSQSNWKSMLFHMAQYWTVPGSGTRPILLARIIILLSLETDR